MVRTVAVTGGTGFIGQNLIKEFLRNGVRVISVQRSTDNSQNIETRYFNLAEKSSMTKELLGGVDVIVHTAALVHDASAGPDAHRIVNYEATKQLFELSKQMHVKKFVFHSTVGVYGVHSHPKMIDITAPTDPKTDYARCKLASEKYLLARSDGRMKVSVLRLPLVCGTGAPGNFGLIDKWAKRNVPLPFGFADNRRSLISVDALASVLVDACEDLQLHLGLNLLTETMPLSTKQLIAQLRYRYGMHPNLLPIPKIVMKLLLTAIGKKRMYEQLFDDLLFISSIKVPHCDASSFSDAGNRLRQV